MHVSRQDAMRIVKEMSGIIERPVNMMDEKGTIIASTNPKRIGQFHEGASRIIQNKLDRMTVENDREYAGAREGVNFPILFQNEIVGVVGVTGPQAEVAKYGEIIKKMTEILLLDVSMREQKLLDENNRNRFLEQWIFAEHSAEREPEFAERGKSVGIDIRLPRRVGIFSPSDGPNGESREQMERIVKKLLRPEKENLFFRSGAELVCLIPWKSDHEMRRLAGNLLQTVKEELGVSLCAGIDCAGGKGFSAYHSYHRAKKALQAALFQRSTSVCFYDEVTVGIFLDEISETGKREYVQRIFKGCAEDEISSWAHLLEAFFRENDSITRTAEELFIHKNTLQYRLKKLSEETGLDARKMPDAALFYLAVLFYRNLDSGQADAQKH